MPIVAIIVLAGVSVFLYAVGAHADRRARDRRRERPCYLTGGRRARRRHRRS